MIESSVDASISYDKKDILVHSGLLGKIQITEDSSLVRYLVVENEYWYMSADVCKALKLRAQDVKRIVTKTSWIKRAVRAENFYQDNHVKSGDDLYLANDNYNFLNTDALLLLLQEVKKPFVQNLEPVKQETNEQEIDIKVRGVKLGLAKSTHDYIKTALRDPDLIKAFLDFCIMRKKSKKAPVTDASVKLLIDRLADISGKDIPTAIQIVKNSTVNCWKTFFPLKDMDVEELKADTNEKSNSNVLSDDVFCCEDINDLIQRLHPKRVIILEF